MIRKIVAALAFGVLALFAVNNTTLTILPWIHSAKAALDFGAVMYAGAWAFCIAGVAGIIRYW